MEKISWVDKKTNEEILNMVQEDRQILNPIWCHKHKWMGHVLRHDGLLRDVLEGCWVKEQEVEGYSLDDLLEKNYTDLKKVVEDRSVWRWRTITRSSAIAGRPCDAKACQL